MPQPAPSVRRQPRFINGVGRAEACVITAGMEVTASSCTITGSNGDTWAGFSGSKSSYPITQVTTYIIQCDDADPDTTDGDSTDRTTVVRALLARTLIAITLRTAPTSCRQSLQLVSIKLPLGRASCRLVAPIRPRSATL
jgi:hypothetical protein